MATGPVVNQGKGRFLREFLASNRDAKVEDVTAAWQAEGHHDGISESLVSKIRSELGLTGKRGINGRATGDDGSKKAKSQPDGTKGKGKKSPESPPSPDDREDAKGPSRSSFVEELLGREPGANLKQVNEAWASAGHEGQVSPSIYYKIKRERGGTKETSPVASKSEPGPSLSDAKSLPTTPKADQAAGPPEAAASPAHRQIATSNPTTTTANRADGHGRELHEIEGEIDELMFRLKGLGNFAEVQEALRAARRLLVRSHQH